MMKKFLIILIAGSTLMLLGPLSGSADPGATSMKNITFEDLGFQTKSCSGGDICSIILPFNSPIKDPKSFLYLHLNIIDDGRAKVEINNATLFSKNLYEGIFFEKLPIPSGMIKEGMNILNLSFSGDYNSHFEMTILDDSAISFENVLTENSVNSHNGISSIEQGLGIVHKNVAIESNLNDAWILLDGVNQSKKAPNSIDINKPGKHDIILKKDDITISRNVEVNESLQKVEFDLNEGKLKVQMTYLTDAIA